MDFPVSLDLTRGRPGTLHSGRMLAPQVLDVNSIVRAGPASVGEDRLRRPYLSEAAQNQAGVMCCRAGAVSRHRGTISALVHLNGSKASRHRGNPQDWWWSNEACVARKAKGTVPKVNVFCLVAAGRRLSGRVGCRARHAPWLAGTAGSENMQRYSEILKSRDKAAYARLV